MNEWRVRNERLSKGFAHRFRPTYAGANVGHGGFKVQVQHFR